ncbi:hypothetical protein BCR21_08780 [Enterococcus ureasiticus]|uniref:Uncharacterized protein n=1 Tax=Enterococcus ureasiticus TaxID=903984 RepID=A0A1E5GFA5_9ENTE|nr:hypothetical protein BCR21_08780 [Enterococcus ureasiticus]
MQFLFDISKRRIVRPIKDSARPECSGDEERAYRKIRRIALGTALYKLERKNNCKIITKIQLRRIETYDEESRK